ncbi:uncharacterized protein BDW47DRAFT_29383 [Aspergillus candidus]|uniref:Uncharacterized protein n=1 Tax=Aspergillus candidus TaxID=41067 RepID=A0A2I2FC25_ASPCN|nr:hypothetical protein BDW47DRAFT_29383 [Aspergillus candidus]PLB38179.1 hypothetical protein BDW47DRAFT_29383 [Aspergillus candidus]
MSYDRPPSRPSSPTIDSAILQQVTNPTTPADLHDLLLERDEDLLDSASRVATILGLEPLLTYLTPRLPNAPQIALRSAAYAGNSPLFRHLLHQYPPGPQLSLGLRLAAAEGGVGIWEALEQMYPGCIHDGVGHHGDLLSVAVDRGSEELVRYLVDKGIDVPNSGSLGLSVLQLATRRGLSDEIVELLARHGARDPDARE